MENGGTLYIRGRVSVELATNLVDSKSNAIIICTSRISDKVKDILHAGGITAYENVTVDDIKKARDSLKGVNDAILKPK